MKAYPSIEQSMGTKFQEIPGAYVFDKLDGSNLRFEWAKKTGWYKFGTRHRLFDKNDWQFGRAIQLFEETVADIIADISVQQRWEKVIVFAEFWGPKSFAGVHHDKDNLPLDADKDMHLTMFDVAPYKQGLLDPNTFLKLFEDKVPTPKFLGQHNWTRGFVQKVFNNDVPGITFEGVVGKLRHDKHDLVMAKAKTKLWLDKIRALYSPEESAKLINS